MEETLKASMQAIIEKEKEVRKYIRKHTKAGKEAWDMWSDFVYNCPHTYTDNKDCRFCRHIDTTNGLCNVSFNCPDYIKEKGKET